MWRCPPQLPTGITITLSTGTMASMPSLRGRPRRGRLSIDPYFVAGTLCVAVVFGVLFLRNRQAAERDIAPETLVQLTASPPVRSLGRPEAPVHVVEFSDYECSACAAAHRALWPLLEQGVRDRLVRYEVRDLVLPSHAGALTAAIIAECGARQDSTRYWSMRDAVFENQSTWSLSFPIDRPLLALVSKSGIDSTAVRGCMDRHGGEIAARIRRSWRVAAAGGIDFTPLWLVNRKPVPWPQLAEVVRSAAKQAQ